MRWYVKLVFASWSRRLRWDACSRWHCSWASWPSRRWRKPADAQVAACPAPWVDQPGDWARSTSGLCCMIMRPPAGLACAICACWCHIAVPYTGASIICHHAACDVIMQHTCSAVRMPCTRRMHSSLGHLFIYLWIYKQACCIYLMASWDRQARHCCL